MRRLAEHSVKLPAEVGGRGVRYARERRDIEGLREGSIHCVACTKHAPVALLPTPLHAPKRRTGNRRRAPSVRVAFAMFEFSTEL